MASPFCRILPLFAVVPVIVVVADPVLPLIVAPELTVRLPVIFTAPVPSVTVLPLVQLPETVTAGLLVFRSTEPPEVDQLPAIVRLPPSAFLALAPLKVKLGYVEGDALI